MSTVDEVKTRLDIVDVIGGYVRLQKAGRYFKALCPFHTEKTPSFVVYPDRQSWHCFGACATGGDVLAFISRKENLDFSGALRLMADRAGVELRSDGPRREEIKTLQDANEAAALYYANQLQSAPAARAYVEERGLDAQTISDFQIGYAQSGWEGLRGYLKARGFDDQKLIDAGLVIESDRGGYDRFRDRIMFPIRDDRGRVVGFGGRILPGSTSDRGDPGPKYMNTPQTPIFDKGGVLYGLDRARDEIRRTGAAVIVEGYMDVIAAHQHGFRNVVASMGTALTDKQAALVQRFAGRVVLAMDADEAGSAANLRAIQVVAATAQQLRAKAASGMVRSQPLDIRVLALSQGKDPDELIRSDPQAWTAAIESAKPVVDHLLAVEASRLDLTQPRDRSQLVTEVLPTIGEISDPVVQAHYLQRLSRLARISEDALRRELPRRPRPNRRQTEGSESPSADAGTAAIVSKPVTAPREEFLMALLYRRPELGGLGTALTEELFNLSENRELLRRWRAGEAVSEEEIELWEHYQKILETRTPQAEMGQGERAFLDCVHWLEQDRMRAVKEASALALAEGAAGVRPGQIAAIARARLEAGEPEEIQTDEPAEAAASLFLEDNENSLRLHRRSVERSRSDQAGRSPQ